jgi:hypothetical protein
MTDTFNAIFSELGTGQTAATVGLPMVRRTHHERKWRCQLLFRSSINVAYSYYHEA